MYGPHISFWYLNDETQIQYYGNKVSIQSLTTYPGVIHANVILSDKDLLGKHMKDFNSLF